MLLCAKHLLVMARTPRTARKKRAEAAAKVLAAYDAGCRRFDAALGGLGGCPFAQDQLVGNIPTEEVIKALAQRGVQLPLAPEAAAPLNEQISQQFAS